MTLADEYQPPPATDWATDFDHADPCYNRDAPAIWAQLRDVCPVAHTDRYGGTWLPVTHADVRQIAYDTDNYTSRQVIVTNARLDLDLAGIGPAPPITSDPPFHQIARKLLLPYFRPDRIAPLETEVRVLCRQLCDQLADGGPDHVIDAATGYAQHIPPAVISRMLGFPAEDDDLFRVFVHRSIEGITKTEEQREAEQDEFYGYLDAQIDDHLAHPRDDLTGRLLESEILGQKLSREHVRGSILLLLIAGIDTTWSAIGSAIWHLAQHPGDRHRLRADPDVVPFAVEEMLRAYAPVTMARLVARDHDLHGCPMKVEDWVLLPFPAANLDPAAFERPDEVIIDRQVNRHAAFGLGIHRCLGSNLARLELRVAMEEFVQRFPDFELADPAAVTWSLGQIRGPRALPLRVT